MILLLTLLSTLIPVSPGESIQEALDTAVQGDTVLLLEGTHTGAGQNLFALTGLHGGVVLQGNPGEPWRVILSGEGLQGRIATVDGSVQGQVDTSTVISGVTFSSGDSGQDPFGGAVYVDHASPLFKDCVFIECTADNGGAVYSWKGGPVFRNCLFQDNEVESAGGAVYLYSSQARLEHCRFVDNTSWDDGGAVYCYHCSPDIFNCLFKGGYAHDDGGGVYCYALSDPTISFCTFNDNFALYTGSAVYFRVNCSPEISHCIATENQGPAFYIQDGGSPTFFHNCVWGNPDGNYGNLPDPTGTQGNISQDPLLIQDFHLSQTAAGQSAQSPCADAGSDSPEVFGLQDTWTRTDSIPDSSTVDIGYHHGFGSGSQSGQGAENPPPFTVSPNPSIHTFSLYLSSGTDWETMEIVNISGRIVLESEIGSSPVTVDTGLLEGPGIYFVIIRGQGISSSRSVCVLR